MQTIPRKFRYLILLASVLAFLPAAPVYAGTCSNPAGAEADLTYNKNYHTMQFCDGTNWISWKQNPTYAPTGGSGWNPSDMGAGITLSGGNLLATQNSLPNTWRTVRSTSSYTVGTNHKVIFALTVSAYDNNIGWDGGVADSTASLSNNVGSSGKAFGAWLGNGSQTSGGVTSGGNCNGSFGAGSTMYYAVDFNTGKLWCSTNCAAWSGTPDSGASNNVTLTSSTAFFIAWSGDDNGASDAATVNTVPNLAGCTGVSTFTTWN